MLHVHFSEWDWRIVKKITCLGMNFFVSIVTTNKKEFFLQITYDFIIINAI